MQYASLPGAMINTHLLELPLSGTYFHGLKGVRAIEVRLYFAVLVVLKLKSSNGQVEKSREKELFAVMTLISLEVLSDTHLPLGSQRKLSHGYLLNYEPLHHS